MNNINNTASHIKEKNIIPNIRRFVTNELGENYWLHGCLRYVMEALGLTLRVEVGVAAHLAREGFDPASGARPLRRRIQRLVEERVAEELLAGRLRRGDGVKVGLRENELAIEREKE